MQRIKMPTYSATTASRNEVKLNCFPCFKLPGHFEENLSLKAQTTSNSELMAALHGKFNKNKCNHTFSALWLAKHQTSKLTLALSFTEQASASLNWREFVFECSLSEPNKCTFLYARQIFARADYCIFASKIMSLQQLTMLLLHRPEFGHK